MQRVHPFVPSTHLICMQVFSTAPIWNSKELSMMRLATSRDLTIEAYFFSIGLHQLLQPLSIVTLFIFNGSYIRDLEFLHRGCQHDRFTALF